MALKNVAPPKRPIAGKPQNQDDDDIFEDGAHARSDGEAPSDAGDTGAETVRLTDISDIVSKYAVVDSFFDETPQDEPAPADPKPGVAAVDEEEGLNEEPETEDGPEVVDDAAPRRAAEALSGMLFSPLARRHNGDELHSNWSDNARNAIQEIGSTKLMYQQPSEEPAPVRKAEASAQHATELLDEAAEEEEAQRPRANVVKRHKRTLIHTAALCTALPVVAGVTFALTVYTQKDIKPADLWDWAVASVSNPGQAVPEQSTPEEAQAPARLPQEDGLDTPTVAPSEQAAAVSPENLSVQGLSGPAAAPDGSAPAAADEQVSPATQLYMARLTVADAHGTSMEPIPLTLNLTRGQPEQRLRIRISGLPEGATLSAGVDFGHGEWGLQEEDLPGLTMSLPQGFAGEITLLAVVIDNATHIQAGETTPLQVHVTHDPMMVQPAAAPADDASFASQEEAGEQSPNRSENVTPRRSLFPELNMQLPDAPLAEGTEMASLEPADVTADDSEPVPPPLTPGGQQSEMSAEEISALISRGDRMLGLGDIASARLFYERAARSGDAGAATALGKSYDPLIFGSLQVRGVRADPELARVWYMRGAQGGNAEADTNLQRLDAWLSQR